MMDAKADKGMLTSDTVLPNLSAKDFIITKAKLAVHPTKIQAPIARIKGGGVLIFR